MEKLNFLNIGINEQTWQISLLELQLRLLLSLLKSLKKKNKKIDPSKQYNKETLYAILYNIYNHVGQISNTGERSEITFNTWGFSSNKLQLDLDKEDGQIFGKTSYAMYFEYEIVKRYLSQLGSTPPIIVELGCGNGGGAYLIRTQIITNCIYKAYDMQKSAIDSARSLHTCKGLTFYHKNASNTELNPNSVDIVIANETDFQGNDKFDLWNEVVRILKTKGLYVTGNFLVKNDKEGMIKHFSKKNMKLVEIHDWSKESIIARDLDVCRLERFKTEMFKILRVFKLPILGKKYKTIVETWLDEWLRMPGTILYNNIVEGKEQYLQMVFQKS
jgi:SAM-dependent methyltransferase